MGANIPLPALDVRTQFPNPLDEYMRAVQLKGAQQQQQLQAGQLAQQQQDIKDRSALTEAMKNWDPTTGYESLQKSVLDNGGSGNAALVVQQHLLQVEQARETLNKDQRDNFVNNAKAFGDHVQALEGLPDEQLHQSALDQLMSARRSNIIGDDEFKAYVNGVNSTADPQSLRQHIDQIAKLKLGAATVMAQKGTEAETAEKTAKARQENAEAAMKEIEAAGMKGLTPQIISDQVDKVFDPKGVQSGQQNRLVKSQAQAALARGDYAGAKKALDDGFQSALNIQKEVAEATNPSIQSAKLALSIAEKKAAEAISDGDPKSAAQLLVSGAVAPSQLISSRKPAFAQQAFSAAKQLDPTWDATKADADFTVAKSPANLAFFGSAKSLTDKGGTLDQLKAAAKDIPENQFPVFNSVADWIKASTGSGPIAKYAALGLGVADDYSKVMGGGQGSDTSRVQALNLIAAKESPEQKEASLEGIRGAVNSQKNSRIGGNRILQKMYGGEEESGGDFFSKFGGHAKPKTENK